LTFYDPKVEFIPQTLLGLSPPPSLVVDVVMNRVPSRPIWITLALLFLPGVRREIPFRPPALASCSGLPGTQIPFRFFFTFPVIQAPGQSPFFPLLTSIPHYCNVSQAPFFSSGLFCSPLREARLLCSPPPCVSPCSPPP